MTYSSNNFHKWGDCLLRSKLMGQRATSTETICRWFSQVCLNTLDEHNRMVVNITIG